MKLTGLWTLLLMIPAAAQAGELPKCFDASRDGHCVAVQVNGQNTVRLTKKTKKMLEALGALSQGGGETRYEVPQPITVRVHGSKQNWDRQTLFVQVVE